MQHRIEDQLLHCTKFSSCMLYLHSTALLLKVTQQSRSPVIRLAMSGEGTYTYEEQQVRARLLRQRLRYKSLNGWFRNLPAATRNSWLMHFPQDPLTGREFRSGSRDQNQAGYAFPQGVKLTQMPEEPIDFTPPAPSTPPAAPEVDAMPPWKKRRSS